MRYYYFITYEGIMFNGGNTKGNYFLDIDVKVKRFSQIKLIMKQLKQELGLKSVVILNMLECEDK